MAADDEFDGASDGPGDGRPNDQPQPSDPPVWGFWFHEQRVRTMVLNGDPWFVAVDVCAVLEIANSRHAVSRLDDDEKGVTNSDTLGGRQALTVISESGLYHLILTSRKSEAKFFRRWITGEVIPEIFRTGSYRRRRQPSVDGGKPSFGSMPATDIPLTMMEFFDVMGCWPRYGAGVQNRDHAEMELRRWLTDRGRGDEAAPHPSRSIHQVFVYSRQALDDWWAEGAGRYVGVRQIV